MSEHAEYHAIEIICYPFYLGLLSLLSVVINLNKRKFRRRYGVDEIFLFIIVYAFNVLVTWNFFDFIDKLPRFIITLILIFGIQHFVGRAQIIGITGGIGCGKSTVSKYFREFLKIEIIDCDEIAKQILVPGQPAYKMIVERFGRQILKAEQVDQEIDRQALADVVFKNPVKRQILTSITHRFIFKEILKQLWRVCFVKKDQYVVIDAPLLFESKFLGYLCYPIITVVMKDQSEQVKRYVQIQETLQRVQLRNGWTEEQVIERINSQMPIEQKMALSDIILTNDKTEKDLIKQIQGKVFELLI